MKGAGNSDDRFNVSNVLFSMVDSVADLGNSGSNSSLSVNIVCKGDCCVTATK